MKLFNFTTLILLSIFLLISAGKCFYLESRIDETVESSKEVTESMGSLIKKYQAGEVSITNEQIISYLNTANEKNKKMDIFFNYLGDAWGSLGIYLGLIALFQLILSVNGWFILKADVQLKS